MPKMEDYKDCHKDEDVYVLASGKSVDFIPTSFFENKTIIGVNQVYKKNTCKYLLRKECDLLNEAIKSAPKAVHFISRLRCGCQDANQQYIKKFKITDTSKIVIYNHNINTCKMPKTLPKEPSLVTSHSTITTAIHLAAYMGAKNIILVGHDGGLINGECNFKGYHTDSTYKITWSGGKKDYKKWVTNIDDQTITLKAMLKTKYNLSLIHI